MTFLWRMMATPVIGGMILSDPIVAEVNAAPNNRSTGPALSNRRESDGEASVSSCTGRGRVARPSIKRRDLSKPLSLPKTRHVSEGPAGYS